MPTWRPKHKKGRQGKKTQAEMVIPPSYPPLPPPPSRFLFSTTIHEEGNASADQINNIRHPSPPMISISSSVSRMRCDFFAPHGGQTTLDATSYKDKFKEAKKAMENFWYYFDILFNVANLPYWDYMVAAIAACGPGLKAPNYQDLQGPIFDEVVTDIRRAIKEYKKIWRKKGYNILRDGWNARSGRDLLNFLVSSSRGLVFLKSLDASRN